MLLQPDAPLCEGIEVGRLVGPAVPADVPEPRSSAMIRTMLGFPAASAAASEDTEARTTRGSKRVGWLVTLSTRARQQLPYRTGREFRVRYSDNRTTTIRRRGCSGMGGMQVRSRLLP